MPNKKLAFVVQRYGLEVNGGAEFHCQLIAEHMSKYFDVEVLTTCAVDYITWKNEYTSGLSIVNGISVRRFPVNYERDIAKFDIFSEKIFSRPFSLDDEIDWMKMQGPYSKQLLKYLKNTKDQYDFFIFFTYLYCTTFFGLTLVKDKAILIPTAHDEPPIYLSIFNSLFSSPQAIIYNTEEERRFVNSKFKNAHILSDTVGVGIDIPKNVDAKHFKDKYKLDNFIIYVGRIDESKGCKQLFEYFLKFKGETSSDLKLVLLGKSAMKIPDFPDIIPLGFVSDQDKFNAIKAASFLVMPSKYESLSMVLLETWLCFTPVLVNGDCDVLRGQCIRSNAGLWYANYDEFKECMKILLKNDDLRIKMSENGKKFVEENYSWEIVERKYLDLLEKLNERND